MAAKVKRENEGERKEGEVKKNIISWPYLLLYELQLTRKSPVTQAMIAVSSGADNKCREMSVLKSQIKVVKKGRDQL